MYAHQLAKRVRDELRSNRKRRHYGAGSQRAIIRTLGDTPGLIHPEISLDVVDSLPRWSGTVTGAQTPAKLSVTTEFSRILLDISLLHVHGTATVLEIVEAFGSHEPIDNSVEVEPTVTELVNEQRTCVEVFDPVVLPPGKCFLPRTVGLRRQRECRRP